MRKIYFFDICDYAIQILVSNLQSDTRPLSFFVGDYLQYPNGVVGGWGRGGGGGACSDEKGTKDPLMPALPGFAVEAICGRYAETTCSIG